MIVLLGVSDMIMRIVHNNLPRMVEFSVHPVEFRRSFYWKGMFRDIENFCSNCDIL